MMITILGLLALCIAPWAGTITGELMAKRKWLSNRWRTFVGWVALLSICVTLAFFSWWWTSVVLFVFGFCFLRDARAYRNKDDELIHAGYPHGYVTWGDPNFRYHSLAHAQRQEVLAMEEAAIASPYPQWERQLTQSPARRKSHLRMVVNNGYFPPLGKTAPRGGLRVVK